MTRNNAASALPASLWPALRCSKNILRLRPSRSNWERAAISVAAAPITASRPPSRRLRGRRGRARRRKRREEARQMAEYKWPEEGKRSLIGKRISRLDGPDKVSGRAKYTFDINRPGMLFGKILRSPYAHAKIVSIDTSAAEKIVGKDHMSISQRPGGEIQWVDDETVTLAAVHAPAADDAARAINAQYEQLPHFVSERDLDAVPPENRRKPTEEVKGDPDKALAAAEV